jgi:NitT/TauT family transport system substrate-binding protein
MSATKAKKKLSETWRNKMEKRRMTVTRSAVCRRFIAPFAIISIILGSLPASASEKDTVRVGVLRSSWLSVIHAVAMTDGYYDRHGLVVDETDFNSGDGTAGLESVLRGSLEIYIGTLDEITRVNAQAIAAHRPPPLAAIAAGNPSSSVLVLRQDIPYHALSDLKGKTIAVSSLGSGHLINFRYLLAQTGLTTDVLNLRLVRISAPDMPSALLTKQIDGFIHSEPTVTTAVIKAHGKIALQQSDFGAAGSAPALGVIALRSWVALHRATAAAVVAALWQASNDYENLPREDTEKIFADYLHVTPEVVSAAYSRVDPRLYDLRKMAEMHFKVTVPEMVRRGEVTVDLKPEDIFDFEFSQ